jgi:hypothetical protein
MRRIRSVCGNVMFGHEYVANLRRIKRDTSMLKLGQGSTWFGIDWYSGGQLWPLL